MKRTMLGYLGLALLLLGIGAGQTTLHAQVHHLIGKEFPTPTVPPCNDPSELTCGGTLGLNAVTLYPHSSGRKTAKNICDTVKDFAPGNPVYVKQLFSTSRWVRMCGDGACFTCLNSEPCAPVQPFPTGEGGAPLDDCFYVDPAEAVLIRMKDNATVDFGGAPIVQTVPLGPVGSGSTGDWWVGSPSNYASYQHFADSLGLTSTGTLRGSILKLNPDSGSTTLILAGTAAAGTTPFPNDGAGYLVRDPNGFTWHSDATYLLPKVRAYRNIYCVTGTGTMTDYSWWIEISGGSPAVIGETSVESAVPLLPEGATPIALAEQLAARINAIAMSQNSAIHVGAVSTAGCFEIQNSQFKQGFALWVGPGSSTYPLDPVFAVTQSGVTYNPTIKLSGTVPTLGTVAMAAVFLLLLVAAALLLR